MKKWGFSSAGRAPALQAGGQGFDSLNLHQYGRIAQVVAVFTAVHSLISVSEMVRTTKYGRIAQVVRAHA